MTEPIIINGVDVSECIYIDENTIPQDCGVNCSFCYEFKNCYYKQFKRKEQECEKYKKCLNTIKCKCEKTIKEISPCINTNSFLGGQYIEAENILKKISEVENVTD